MGVAVSGSGGHHPDAQGGSSRKWADMYSLAFVLGGQCRGRDGKQVSVGEGTSGNFSLSTREPGTADADGVHALYQAPF